jgi:hypothetical protein
MTRHYAPKTVLRQVSNSLLKEFFDHRNLLQDVLWHFQGPREIQKIFDAWQALPREQREEVERAFRSVHEMACEAGIKALVEDGSFHEVDLATEFGRLEGFYDRAMWAYLRHHEIFYVASIISYADGLLRGRYWIRRNDLPPKSPDVSSDTIQALANALSDYYRREQGRGQRCTVERYLRVGRYHYFFAYPDDYTDTYIGHAEDGTLMRRPQKRAFEVIFVYDPESGTLDLFAQGDRRLKNHLQQIFGLLILHERLKPDDAPTRVYELNGLLYRDFAFPTDPQDGIEEVRVRALRLSLVGSGGGQISIEAAPKESHEDIYDIMDRYLAKGLVPALNFNVTQATLDIRFAPTNGSRSRRSLVFDVTYPDSSNLKSKCKNEEDRLLAEKYLKRWDIERA